MKKAIITLFLFSSLSSICQPLLKYEDSKHERILLFYRKYLVMSTLDGFTNGKKKWYESGKYIVVVNNPYNDTLTIIKKNGKTTLYDKVHNRNYILIKDYTKQ